MAIKLNDGFAIGSQAPIDTRILLSLEEMKTINENTQPDAYFAICKDNGLIYTYNKENEEDETTGKFREYSSSSGTSDYDDLENQPLKLNGNIVNISFESIIEPSEDIVLEITNNERGITNIFDEKMLTRLSYNGKNIYSKASDKEGKFQSCYFKDDNGLLIAELKWDINSEEIHFINGLIPLENCKLYYVIGDGTITVNEYYKEFFSNMGGSNSFEQFIGTQEEWDNLTLEEKAKYDGKEVIIIDNADKDSDELEFHWVDKGFGTDLQDLDNGGLFSSVEKPILNSDSYLLVDLSDRYTELKDSNQEVYIFFRSKNGFVFGKAPENRYIAIKGYSGQYRVCIRASGNDELRAYLKENVKIYHKKLDFFDPSLYENRKFNFAGSKCVFTGDSITYGHTPSGQATWTYPKRFGDFVKAGSVVNLGVSGATYAEMSGLPRIIAQLQNAKENHFDTQNLFVAAGINDWIRGVSLETFKSAIAETFEYIVSNFNSHIYIISPINYSFADTKNIIAPLETYSQIEKEYAIKYGFNFIDGFKLGFPATAGFEANKMFADGIHPTQLGYNIYGVRLAEKLSNLGNSIITTEGGTFTGKFWSDGSPIYEAQFVISESGNLSFPFNVSMVLNCEASLSDGTNIVYNGFTNGGSTFQVFYSKANKTVNVTNPFSSYKTGFVKMTYLI